MTFDRADYKRCLVSFLQSFRRSDVAVADLDERAGLVASGFLDSLDSLALLEIVTFLEAEFGLDFSATGIDPDELSSIGDILDLIERRRG